LKKLGWLINFIRKNNYNTVFTEDGDYFHPKDNLLYKALLGFDPKTGETFSWTQYKNLQFDQTSSNDQSDESEPTTSNNQSETSSNKKKKNPPRVQQSYLNVQKK